MECGISVNRFPIIILLILMLCASAPPSRADHAMILIANADSPIEELGPLDLRKLYLGFPVMTPDGTPIRPLSNASDARLGEIFLQDVMGMSARSYDRRLLTLTLQSGRPRPEVIEDVDVLLQRIDTNLQSITFVWDENIQDLDNVKVLRVLWHR